MANVNVAQWLTLCAGLPASATVTITAGELLALINLAGGSSAVIPSTSSSSGTDSPAVDANAAAGI